MTRYFVYLLILVAIVAIVWSYNTSAPDLSFLELKESHP